MRSVHLHITLVAAALSFGCQSEPAPTEVTLNNQILYRKGAAADAITGGCSTLVHGQSSPASDPEVRDSWAPDLLIAETFDGNRLSVAAQTTGTSESREMTFDFNNLKAGTHDRFTLTSAQGGSYELRYWTYAGGSCQYEPSAPSPPF